MFEWPNLISDVYLTDDLSCYGMQHSVVQQHEEPDDLEHLVVDEKVAYFRKKIIRLYAVIPAVSSTSSDLPQQEP